MHLYTPTPPCALLKLQFAGYLQSGKPRVIGTGHRVEMQTMQGNLLAGASGGGAIKINKGSLFMGGCDQLIGWTIIATMIM